MPELVDIFRDQRERLPQQLSSVQRHAVHDICVCRSPEMERGTLYLCQNCGTNHFIWQSCGNRNCPKCGNDKITKWLAERQSEILPLDYYMITFSLPAEFRSACLRFPTDIYGAFFTASSSALKQLALDKRFLGAEIGMMGTLQTWRRDGEFHPHIHFLVPGGGLSQDGTYWIFPKNRKFLIAAKPLMKLFKGKFKAKINELEHVKNIPSDVWSKDWIVDCRNVGNGMSSFKYLGTYMQRVFISNDRIEKYDGEKVTFRYTESGNGQTVRRIMPDWLLFKCFCAIFYLPVFRKHVIMDCLEAHAKKLSKKSEL